MELGVIFIFLFAAKRTRRIDSILQRGLFIYV